MNGMGKFDSVKSSLAYAGKNSQAKSSQVYGSDGNSLKVSEAAKSGGLLKNSMRFDY